MIFLVYSIRQYIKECCLAFPIQFVVLWFGNMTSIVCANGKGRSFHWGGSAKVASAQQGIVMCLF